MADRKEYLRQYRLDNSEHIKEQNKQYRQDHKEEINKRVKQWYLNNLEYMKQHQREYRNNNREKVNRWSKTDKGKAAQQRAHNKRRAQEKEMINTLTAQEWIDILKEYKFRCAYCGKEFTLFNRETRDHVIPISKGGNNVKENVVPACKSCNSKKNNKILIEGEMICA